MDVEAGEWDRWLEFLKEAQTALVPRHIVLYEHIARFHCLIVIWTDEYPDFALICLL